MLLGMTKEQANRYNWMKVSTIQSGYSFVVLELLDDSKISVSGVEDIKPIPTERKGRYRFEKVTRQITFRPDPTRGEMLTAYVLITAFNLSFLASHKENRYWDIIDVVVGKTNPGLTLEKVLTDIEDIRDGTIKATVTVGGDDKTDVSTLSIEDLEKEINRRNNKSTKIETKKSELTPAQKGAATRQKNREKAKRLLEPAKEKVSVEKQEEADKPIDSMFITEIGVKQPQPQS